MSYYIDVRVLEYNDTNGRSPYKDWFDGLDAQAAAKVAVAVTRMSLGNLSNVKPVGKAYWNSGSISDQAIASTSAETAARSSSC